MFEPSPSLVVSGLLWLLALEGAPDRGVRSTGPSEAADGARDPATMSPDAALGELVDLQRQVAGLAAREVRLLVRAAGATRVVREVLVEDLDDQGRAVLDRAPRRLELVDEVVEEIAAALNRSSNTVDAQLEIARQLHGPLRATLEALSEGRISYWHARAIAEQARRLETLPRGADPAADLALDQACESMQARVLAQAAGLTVAQTRALAARAVTSIDPAGAARRREQARADCDVRVRAGYDGLALLQAALPALDAARILATVDASARGRIAEGTVDELDLPAGATLGQVRAATLVALVTGPDRPGSGTRTTVELGVMIDAATLAGIKAAGALGSDGSALVRTPDGWVDIDRSDLVGLLTGPGVHATIRRLVTDPASGALVDRGANGYRVSESLRRWIQARDLTCTFPGCNRSARRCDIDHATDFSAGGRTVVANTRALCRRHHNAKTHSGWRIEASSADGSCTFISPGGLRYHHLPRSLSGAPVAPVASRATAPERATAATGELARAAPARAAPDEPPPF